MFVKLDLVAGERASVMLEEREPDEQKITLRSTGYALSYAMKKLTYLYPYWQYDWEYQELEELGDFSSDVISRNLVWIEINVRCQGIYLARILKVEKFYGYLQPLDSLIGSTREELDSSEVTVVFLPAGCTRNKAWLIQSVNYGQSILSDIEATQRKIDVLQLCANLKRVPKGSYRAAGECI